MSEVTDTLDALANGDKTLDDVITEFQARTWPKAASKPPDLLEDPRPVVPNSFEEVAFAYFRGLITIQ